jgi:hypothetical protein
MGKQKHYDQAEGLPSRNSPQLMKARSLRETRLANSAGALSRRIYPAPARLLTFDAELTVAKAIRRWDPLRVGHFRSGLGEESGAALENLYYPVFRSRFDAGQSRRRLSGSLTPRPAKTFRNGLNVTTDLTPMRLLIRWTLGSNRSQKSIPRARAWYEGKPKRKRQRAVPRRFSRRDPLCRRNFPMLGIRAGTDAHGSPASVCRGARTRLLLRPR